jgi:hypothetical protein
MRFVPLSSNRQLIFLAAALYPESIADLTQMSCVDDLRYLEHDAGDALSPAFFLAFLQKSRKRW